MNHAPRLLVGFLFFLSGLASLVLETVWVRMMVLVFGSTTFAVSTVLTAFMAGLALGCWLAGRKVHGTLSARRAVAIYGLLELGIGFYALLMPLLVARLPELHAAAFGTAQSSYHAFALVRFVICALILAIPTTAMGATLPVLAHYFCAGRQNTATGKTVGSLYAINTSGAVAGVLLAGFVLLPAIGTHATNLTACITDLVLGVLALFLAWNTGRKVAGPEAPPEEQVGSGVTESVSGTRTPWPRQLPPLALASIGVSGAVAMIYQVCWTRSLSLVIGSSTYAFSLILVCFLLGLSLGAVVYARRKTADPAAQAGNLSVIHLLIAFTCFGGMLIMDRLPILLLALMQRVELSPLVMFLLKFAVASMVILLPTFFMGMIFPAVIRIYSARGLDAARTTGDVYSINTLGAIVGSFAGGFVLVPLVGLQQTLVAMVLCGLALALAFGAMAHRRKDRIVLPAAALVCAAAVILVGRPWDLELLTSGVFRVSRYEHVLDDLEQKKSGSKARTPVVGEGWARLARGMIPPEEVLDTYREPTEGYRVVLHKEGITTTVTTTRTVDRSLSRRACWVRTALLVNGKPDASLSVLHGRPPAGCKGLLTKLDTAPVKISPSGDAETQILSGLLPVAVHAGTGPPDRALIIGWGSGITVGALLQSGVRRIVAVELEQQVVAAARLFEPHNHTPQTHRRVEVVNADGRNYLATSKKRFDLVISEPSNPWMSGCGNLFTREFFQLVRRRLTPDGLYLQWLQAYEIAPDNVWSILATLSSVFPSVHVFSPAQAPTDMLLVARPRPGKLDWTSMARRLAAPRVRRELAQVGIHTPADLAARLLAAPAGVLAVSGEAQINTDDNARIEFAAPKDLINYSKYSARSITRRLRRQLPDPLAAFTNVPADAGARLCWAALRAGRVRWITERWKETTDQGPLALRRCRATAVRLRLPLEPPSAAAVKALLGEDRRLAQVQQLLASSPPAALAGLYRLYPHTGPPGDRRAALALAGHLEALAGRHYRALGLLLAARRTAPRGTTGYAPLSGVLSHELHHLGLHQMLVLPDSPARTR